MRHRSAVARSPAPAGAAEPAIVNLTGKALVAAGARIAPEGPPVRVERRARQVDVAHAGRIPVPVMEVSLCEGALPPAEPGRVLLVRREVARAHPERDDLLVPGPGLSGIGRRSPRRVRYLERPA